MALALMPAQGHGWAEEVRRESWSPAYGVKAPMTTLNFGAEVELPAEFSVLLVTLEEAHPGSISFTQDGGFYGRLERLRLPICWRGR